MLHVKAKRQGTLRFSTTRDVQVLSGESPFFSDSRMTIALERKLNRLIEERKVEAGRTVLDDGQGCCVLCAKSVLATPLTCAPCRGLHRKHDQTAGCRPGRCAGRRPGPGSGGW